MSIFSTHLNRKLPAFTLPELIVGMLLMLILFSFVSTLYTIFSQHSRRQFENNRLLMEYQVTKHTLQHDFENARYICFDSESNTFLLQLQTSVKITYRFDSASILRSLQGRTDTLKPGMTVVAKIYTDDSLRLVREVRLQHIYHMQVCHLCLEKRYAWADILHYHDSK